MIVYISPINTSFIQRDLIMLRSNFRVKHLTLTDNPYFLPFSLIIQTVQLLFLLPATEKYLCFFSGYHTVIPVIVGKLFNKEVIIQCGGTDAVNLPEINYGNYRKKWLKMATIFSFKHCSLIAPVAQSLVKSNYTYDKSLTSSQGLLNLIPGLKTPIMVIHNGFDSSFWFDNGNEKTPFSFITVATGISKQNRALVKGIDLIIEMAKTFPEYTFTIVGDEKFTSELPNIITIGVLPQEKIRSLFQEAQFYLQLSSSEGFPNALAEAMLCGCIPIGSTVGAIPEIIGDSGFLLSTKDVIDLKNIFGRLSMADLVKLRKDASTRIRSRFSYEARKEKLLKLLA
ncbi:glycosyltransferase family 4 protein [Cyclobacterium sp.]|uniref:glycosyltransferase family 4 protein n=1 Tax=Cyclobacterium sp. TaxID=1966343 RepID=UPI0019B929C3|nr:glycosyltransferase family 4 protein [Cyclobacterium sp.]MBD3628087.1 glycosyltransferase family 4 protein [Cyclobacterium sp.]